MLILAVILAVTMRTDRVAVNALSLVVNRPHSLYRSESSITLSPYLYQRAGTSFRALLVKKVTALAGAIPVTRGIRHNSTRHSVEHYPCGEHIIRVRASVETSLSKVAASRNVQHTGGFLNLRFCRFPVVVRLSLYRNTGSGFESVSETVNNHRQLCSIITRRTLPCFRDQVVGLRYVTHD